MDNFKLINLFEDNILKIKNSKQKQFDNQLFSKKFSQLTKMYFKTDISYTSYLSFMKSYFIALDEGRKNNIALAIHHVKKAIEGSNFDLLQIDELNVYKLSYLTIDAYLLYKNKSYRESIDKTIEVIELDKFFEKKFPFIYFHKIQQLHNISRVHLKSGNFETYSSIIDLLLQSLLFNKKIVFEDQVFNNINYNLNKKLRIMLVYQVFFETIIFLNEQNKFEEKYFKQCFKTIIENNNKFVFNQLNGVFYWVRIKNKLLRNEKIPKLLVYNYLNSSRHFIMDIPTKSLLQDLRKKNSPIFFCNVT